jgi:hypothetical protein
MTLPIGIVAGAITQHRHQDTKQPVCKVSQSLTMPLPFRPKSRIYPAKVVIALHRHSRHVIQGMT